MPPPPPPHPPTKKEERGEHCRHLSHIRQSLPGCQCTDRACDDIRARYSTEACTATRRGAFRTSDGLHRAIVYQVLANNHMVRGLGAQELLYFSHFDINSVKHTSYTTRVFRLLFVVLKVVLFSSFIVVLFIRNGRTAIRFHPNKQQ